MAYPTENFWPHAPTNKLSATGTYLVFAETVNRAHFFATRKRIERLHRGLLVQLRDYDWRLEAWAVFSNHYHFVAQSPDEGRSLFEMLGKFAKITEIWINSLENVKDRRIWQNFRHVQLTNLDSYNAWLRYIHRNATMHGLVKTPKAYPWCSAFWFERGSNLDRVNEVYALGEDKLEPFDDFAPSSEW